MLAMAFAVAQGGLGGLKIKRSRVSNLKTKSDQPELASNGNETDDMCAK